MYITSCFLSTFIIIINIHNDGLHQYFNYLPLSVAIIHNTHFVREFASCPLALVKSCNGCYGSC